ncbi:MAG: SDR family NAD(P)-dependent oxidoreductase [Firmicutes bacterium]|nr:SDR family NAD(P)-dependent oxidoreductase [Bacillota bacterium]
MAGLDLSHRTILVTGASRGIGRAVALALAAEGARLALTARDAQRLAETAEACHAAGAGAVWTLAGDVRDRDFPARCVAGAEAALGPLWGLVNNAGVGHYTPVEELAPEHWDEMMEVNARAPFLFSRAVIPGFKARREGHIVNIASVAGTTTFPRGAGYCASKWAVMALTDVLTAELKPYEVRVTAVCPGSVQTGFAGSTPKPWSLRPEDVAEAVVQAMTARTGVIYNTIIMRPQVPPEAQA